LRTSGWHAQFGHRHPRQQQDQVCIPAETPTFRRIPLQPGPFEPMGRTCIGSSCVPVVRSHASPGRRVPSPSPGTCAWQVHNDRGHNSYGSLSVDRPAEIAGRPDEIQLTSPCPCGLSPRHIVRSLPFVSGPSCHRHADLPDKQVEANSHIEPPPTGCTQDYRPWLRRPTLDPADTAMLFQGMLVLFLPCGCRPQRRAITSKDAP